MISNTSHIQGSLSGLVWSYLMTRDNPVTPSLRIGGLHARNMCTPPDLLPLHQSHTDVPMSLGGTPSRHTDVPQIGLYLGSLGRLPRLLQALKGHGQCSCSFTACMCHIYVGRIQERVLRRSYLTPWIPTTLSGDSVTRTTRENVVRTLTNA